MKTHLSYSGGGGGGGGVCVSEFMSELKDAVEQLNEKLFNWVCESPKSERTGQLGISVMILKLKGKIFIIRMRNILLISY